MAVEQADFFQAIKTGDRGAVEAALDQQPELAGARSADGLSAILTAVYYGREEIVDLLEARGAPMDLFEAAAVGNAQGVRAALAQDPGRINDFAPDGFQALGLACFFGRVEVVDLLLAAGAEVNTPSRNGLAVPPLNSAAAGQQVEIARLLLARGADPNGVQGEGFVPLHAAGENGDVEMIRLLLEHGADPSVKTRDGKTARDLALENGHAEAAALFVPRA